MELIHFGGLRCLSFRITMLLLIWSEVVGWIHLILLYFNSLLCSQSKDLYCAPGTSLLAQGGRHMAGTSKYDSAAPPEQAALPVQGDGSAVGTAALWTVSRGEATHIDWVHQGDVPGCGLQARSPHRMTTGKAGPSWASCATWGGGWG